MTVTTRELAEELARLADVPYETARRRIWRHKRLGYIAPTGKRKDGKRGQPTDLWNADETLARCIVAGSIAAEAFTDEQRTSALAALRERSATSP